MSNYCNTAMIISYSIVYPQGHDRIEDLLCKIPSKSAIEWASYILFRECTKTIDEPQMGNFFSLLFKLNSKMQQELITFLQSIDMESYAFIDEKALLILIQHLLACHNNKLTDVNEDRDAFSNLMLAYLICCDERLKYKMGELKAFESPEDFINLFLPERLKLEDVETPRDYRVELIRFFEFMSFSEKDELFKKYVDLYFKKRKLQNWNEYLHLIVSMYLTMSTNNPPTNRINLSPEDNYGNHFLSIMSVNPSYFMEYPDFRGIKDKPVYKLGNNDYSIIFIRFFLDKLFVSFVFDLCSVLIENSSTTKIAEYPQLKQLIGERFTEKHLLYTIMEGCFSSSCKTIICGEQLLSQIGEGGPDYYLRKGNNIMIVEFKDALMNSCVKYSGDMKVITGYLLKTFVGISEGNKKKIRPKGVSQLVNVIEKKLSGIVKEVEKVDSPNGFNIYPVIVYVDYAFDVEGVNYIINKEFMNLLHSRTICDEYNVREMVMIPLYHLIQLEDFFNDGRLQIFNLLNDYIKERNSMPELATKPFFKTLIEKAHNVGYKHLMTNRFRHYHDSIIASHDSEDYGW